MTLTQEEQDILDGSQGETMAKVLKTIVMHGELFGAERLADCGGAPHTSLYTGGHGSRRFSTCSRRSPTPASRRSLPTPSTRCPSICIPSGGTRPSGLMELDAYALQIRLIQVHTRLGAVPLNKWSCACYLPEVGNTPSRARW